MDETKGRAVIAGRSRRMARRALAFGLAVGAATAATVAAGDTGAAYPGLEQHPLEARALVEPEAVLAALPEALQNAQDDPRATALLQLARANACRVVADWSCQRDAGIEAARAAEAADEPRLAVRGLIAESRALIAVQDYTLGERRLGEAERRLEQHPSAVLSADVYLAYSSLSHNLDKHALAADYADRGLRALGSGEAPAMQARLLRNRARAEAQLGRAAEARATLDLALVRMADVVDPKLVAELHLESARLAQLQGDVAAQRLHGRQVLALADELANSQLFGLGHEVLAIAAESEGDFAAAEAELLTAAASFRSLSLARDELRATRRLLDVQVRTKRPADVLGPPIRRVLELEREIARADRAQAADDFDARLAYARQQFEVEQLAAEAGRAEERLTALAERQRLLGWLIAAGAAMTAVLAGFFLLQRRSNRRLRAALAALRESEARSGDLLRLSRGYVLLHDTDGVLLMANPAAAEALGSSPEALMGRHLQEFVDEPGRVALETALARTAVEGADRTTLTVRGADGATRHWRFETRLSRPEGARPYVVANALDVTSQVQAADALREESRRDALTGAYNRRVLEEFGADRARWGVLALDLDHFKRINDTHGHERGDEVLRGMARFLAERVRGGDLVVRSGGDEFLVLLGDADAASLAALRQRLMEDVGLAPCGFSLGDALREGDEPLPATIARADAGMYRARGERRRS